MPIGGSSGGLSSAGPGAGGGAQGPQGATGSQGPQGHQGFQGNQGTTGAQGPQGGTSGQNFTDGTTTIDAPALVEISGATLSGDATEAVFTLPAPAGVPVVRAFPFTHATPGLATGAVMHTPEVGEILLDAWIQTTTVWNGTTPWGDIGFFVNVTVGLFGSQGFTPPNGPINMTEAPLTIDQGVIGLNKEGRVSAVSTLGDLLGGATNVPAIASTPAAAQPLVPGPLVDGSPYVPAYYSQATPVKVVVSSDGSTTGGDPGSTQGAAILYLMTVQPLT